MAAKQRKKRRKIFVISPSCLYCLCFRRMLAMPVLSYCANPVLSSLIVPNHPPVSDLMLATQNLINSSLLPNYFFLPFLLLVVFHNSGTPLPVYWRSHGPFLFSQSWQQFRFSLIPYDCALCCQVKPQVSNWGNQEFLFNCFGANQYRGQTLETNHIWKVRSWIWDILCSD